MASTSSPRKTELASRPAARGKQGRKERFENLVDKVERVALDLGPGGRLPVVYELRDAMGVSISTLSSALDELEARKVIVRKPGIGIFVSPDVEKRVIALICDPTFFQMVGASPFWPAMIERSRARAQSHNELLELHFASIVGDRFELAPSIVTDLKTGRIDGVLFVGVFQQGVEQIKNLDVPVVVFAGRSPHSVIVDSNGLVRMCAESLGRQGCRRVALWMPDDRVLEPQDGPSRLRDRVAAFRTGLELGGSPFLPELVHEPEYFATQGPWFPKTSRQETGYRLAMKTFSQPRENWPDGIVITEDTMTMGVLSAMQAHGARVGEDVKIATHGNRGSSLLIGFEDKLTVFEVDPNAIVTAMFSMLESLMNGEVTGEQRVLIGPRRRDH